MRNNIWRRVQLYPTKAQETTLETYIHETNRIRQMTFSTDKGRWLDIAETLSATLPIGLVRTAILRGGRNPSIVVTLGTSGPESWSVPTSAHGERPKHIEVVGVGSVRFRGCVDHPVLLSIGKEAHGKWYGYAMERGEQNIKRRRAAIGVDMGTGGSLLTLSNGIRLSPHRDARRLHRKLAGLHARERAQIQGSKRHVATLAEIERVKARLRSCQISHFHRLADFMTRHYSVVGIEQGSCSDTQAKLNAGWAEFNTILARKAKQRHVVLVGVHPGGTSYTCSNCGVRGRKLRLDEREFHCFFCNYSEDRDVNSARVIRQRALKRLSR